MGKSTFTERVCAIVRAIPMGTTMTYKEVAAVARAPGAARAVGSIMKANFNKDIPCHRVIRADGTAGGYNRGGSSAKLRMLRAEGVRI